MTLTLDMVWKVGGIVVLAAILYQRVASLEKQVDKLEASQQWTERNLMHFEYGNTGE